MSSSQKIPDELSTDLSVKMEEHFKPNIQLIPPKATANVFAVLPNQNQNESENTTTFNAPSLFSNNVQQTTDNTSHQVRNNEHMGATQSLSFANIPGRNHEVTVTSDQPRFPAPEDAQHQSQAPTIFSAPLNSSNLLSSGQPPEQDQQQPPHDGASNKENNTTQDHTTQDHTSGQTYSHGIGIVTSNPSSQQQYSQSNSVQPLVYSQTSSNVQYTQQSQATNAYQVMKFVLLTQ
eukprot:TCONS_00043100-protein